MQATHDVTSPLKLLGGARVRQVATMHDEIDVPAVNVGHLVPCIRVPQMRVADESNTQRVLVSKCRLYLRNTLRVQVVLSFDIYIVGVCLKHIIA